MSRIQIILAEPAQTDAYKALKKLGHDLLRDEFVGPVFEDADVYVSDGFAIVTPTGSDVRYFYPAHTVARIKDSPVEVVCAAT